MHCWGSTRIMQYGVSVIGASVKRRCLARQAEKHAAALHGRHAACPCSSRHQCKHSAARAQHQNMRPCPAQIPLVYNHRLRLKGLSWPSIDTCGHHYWAPHTTQDRVIRGWPALTQALHACTRRVGLLELVRTPRSRQIKVTHAGASGLQSMSVSGCTSSWCPDIGLVGTLRNQATDQVTTTLFSCSYTQ